MSKTSGKNSVRLPSPAENRRILRGAKQDPDAAPLTAAQMERMVPVPIARGRPKSDSPKLLVSVRYSQEVIDYFRSTGDGWQSRMDGVLREYVSRKKGKKRTVSAGLSGQ